MEVLYEKIKWVRGDKISINEDLLKLDNNQNDEFSTNVELTFNKNFM